ncbi:MULTISPECIES: hypothetical protein [unclassified Paraburkholderia]|uniref:hypothetical protein n=1 Tax=unclassified Paraburkholderia TaxID=2615204 RepID=UPI001614D61B|nr:MULTISPECIES: hypothetical protein [unclassified Paraburkholderia]MBB5446678.1 hypothetical protein [Paraburkholderia sp. WSM4177]MBB5487223.1 hypothetical protein [Paraburkholderia sp. WSM4180]
MKNIPYEARTMCASVHKALRRLSSIIKSKADFSDSFVDLVGRFGKCCDCDVARWISAQCPKNESISIFDFGLTDFSLIIYLMSNCEFFGKGFQYASHAPPSMRVQRVGPHATGDAHRCPVTIANRPNRDSFACHNWRRVQPVSVINKTGAAIQFQFYGGPNQSPHELRRAVRTD